LIKDFSCKKKEMKKIMGKTEKREKIHKAHAGEVSLPF
jgi:hypothetical protein